MQPLIIVIHVLAAIAIICLVLLQHGKGADVGAAFGSGASNTMFGSQGTMPFLVKLTGSLAAIFFITSLSLAYITSSSQQENDALKLPVSSPTKPAVPENFVPKANETSPTKNSSGE